MIEEVEPEQLKETEQQFIEMLKPTYNDRNANGWNCDKHKEYQKEYNNQLCSYNGETIALATLAKRFQRSGITHSAKEARKYLVL